jgi:hypothetical protein
MTSGFHSKCGYSKLHVILSASTLDSIQAFINGFQKQVHFLLTSLSVYQTQQRYGSSFCELFNVEHTRFGWNSHHADKWVPTSVASETSLGVGRCKSIQEWVSQWAMFFCVGLISGDLINHACFSAHNSYNSPSPLNFTVSFLKEFTTHLHHFPYFEFSSLINF